MNLQSEIVQDARKESLCVNKLYFQDYSVKRKAESQFIENIKYGVFLGRLFDSPVNVYQGSLKTSLPLLIPKMIPDGGSVVLINLQGNKIPQIHCTSEV